MHEMLKKKVKDQTTGYEGTVTAVCEYYDGRISYLVENIDNTGRPVEWWVQSDRIVIVKE